eukprot:2752566-Rhodomonas_salina.1
MVRSSSGSEEEILAKSVTSDQELATSGMASDQELLASECVMWASVRGRLENLTRRVLGGYREVTRTGRGRAGKVFIEPEKGDRSRRKLTKLTNLKEQGGSELTSRNPRQGRTVPVQIGPELWNLGSDFGGGS